MNRLSHDPGTYIDDDSDLLMTADDAFDDRASETVNERATDRKKAAAAMAIRRAIELRLDELRASKDLEYLDLDDD